ncbi:MAG: hypothetical protein RMJ53_10395, partial [Chitinophagales bacterium]|nr:hypothetical protein [Chitinophagales bacterium]
MRYLWKLLFVLLFSFLTSSAIYGQSVEQLYKAGLQSLQSGAYYAAEAYFKQALTKDDSRVEIWNNYAEAARLNNNYTTAIQAYEKVIQLDKTKAFPLSHFWLGSLLIYVQRYNEAIRQLENFQYDYRKEDYYAQKARQLIESCAWALEHQTADNLNINPMPDDINSFYSEINPFFLDSNKFCFSTTRPLKGINLSTYMVLAGDEQPFLPGITASVASHLANGHYSYSRVYGSELFFTVCQSSGAETKCKIYSSVNKNGVWQKAAPLPPAINLPGFTATHPHTYNDAQGGQWLFFVSDRPGGKGRLDIWYSRRISEKDWEYPVNAGNSINSVDDEVTPFVDHQDQVIYFSSAWHYGYGGFDIFYSDIVSLNEARFGEPKNLGLPVNSSANEVYFA